MANPLEKYIPLEAIPLVGEWLEKNRLHLKVSKSRSSKLGDFRPSLNQQAHRISVNGDLNPYHFLLTLGHEVAHAVTWNKYQNKVAPHGMEWKRDYVQTIDELLSRVSFPEQLQKQIEQHLKSPKASSCSDPILFKALKKYDAPKETIHLEDLPLGSRFLLQKNRLFEKGKKRRTRFECLEINTKRKYYVHGLAEVTSLEQEKNP